MRQAKKLNLIRQVSLYEVKSHIAETAPMGRKDARRIHLLNLVMRKDAEALEKRRLKFTKDQRLKGAAIGAIGTAVGYGGSYIATHLAHEVIPHLSRLKDGINLCNNHSNLIESKAVAELTNHRIAEHYDMFKDGLGYEGDTFPHANTLPLPPDPTYTFHLDDHARSGITSNIPSGTNIPSGSKSMSSIAGAAETLNREIPKAPAGFEEFAKARGGYTKLVDGKWKVFVPSKGNSREYMTTQLLKAHGSGNAASEAYSDINDKNFDIGKITNHSSGSSDREWTRSRVIRKDDWMEMDYDEKTGKLTAAKPVGLPEVQNEMSKVSEPRPATTIEKAPAASSTPEARPTSVATPTAERDCNSLRFKQQRHLNKYYKQKKQEYMKL